MKTYKIVTWNIAEAYRSKSADQFHYEAAQDTGYFAAKITALSPDIVCLQESQSRKGFSLSHELAKRIGLAHVFETAAHPSHIHPASMSSSAILTREPFSSPIAFTQVYPHFELTLPNGEPAAKWDEYLQVVTLGGFHVANIKTQPMEFLGHAYETELGKLYAQQLSEMLIQKLSSPLILAGDFNTPDPSAIFSLAREHLNLRDALPFAPTKPHYHGHLDCVFISDEFEVIESQIIPTKSDHFLCYAEVTFTNPTPRQ